MVPWYEKNKQFFVDEIKKKIKNEPAAIRFYGYGGRVEWNEKESVFVVIGSSFSHFIDEDGNHVTDGDFFSDRLREIDPERVIEDLFLFPVTEFGRALRERSVKNEISI